MSDMIPDFNVYLPDVPRMMNVYFMRNDARQKRGYIADVPNNKPCHYVDPFIICQTDARDFPDGILGDSTVRLDLDKLVLQYPDTEDNFGYFSEQGVSDMDNLPVITLDDILRG